jgi:two-component system sensor histidine kinase KdpD
MAVSVLRGTLGLPSALLSYQLLILLVAVVGGLYPAVVAAVAAGLLADWFFIPPLHTLVIGSPTNAVAIVLFVLFALIAAGIVEAAARHVRDAARARAQAATMATLSGSLVAGEDSLPALLDRVRETFAVTSATLLERRETGVAPARDVWMLVGSSGTPPCAHPNDADTSVPVRAGLVLALTGRVLPAADRSVLAAFATQAAAALENRRLSEQAARAATVAAVDRARAALLTAVSHDLRTPLAAAKAAVSSLRAPDVAFGDDDRDELLATADESLDRLARLVENLLDVSRLQSGALRATVEATGLDEIVPLALDLLGPPARVIEVQVPASLPAVLVEPILLERVIAHLTANALRHSPADQPPSVTAEAVGDHVELRVVDHGPGIDPAEREEIFTPIQRFDDVDNTRGLGLGLALSRGLVEAMGGTLVARDTPGGGLTMVVTARVAQSVDATGPRPRAVPAPAPAPEGGPDPQAWAQGAEA